MPVAIVTGGARGIGLAVSRELAKRGFDLALGGRDERRLTRARDAIIDEFRVRCIVQPTDVSDEQQADALVERTQSEFGRINVALVRQLGALPIPSPASGFTYAFDNSTGTFVRSTQSFGPILADRAETIGRGRFAFGYSLQQFSFQTFDGLRCGNDELGYGSGWLVFADHDQTRPPQRSDDEPLIYAYRPSLIGTIIGNREYFDFRPIQKRSTNGTLVFCDDRGAAAARAVIVSYTGRPRTDTVDPAGKRLVCAHSP